MTTKEIFEKVRAHLLAQGKQSISADGVCAYRGADGLQCAVGCLVPDELYKHSMEGNLAFAMASFTPSPFGWRATEGQISLLTRLQQIHDSMPVSRWKSALAQLEDEVDLGAFNDEQ